jgi:hypothetical protein
VLADPVKRHQYDTTGETQEKDASAAYALAIDTFLTAVKAKAPCLGAAIEKLFDERLKGVEKGRKEAQKEETEVGSILARIKSHPANDFLADSLRTRLQAVERGRATLDQMEEDIKKARALLREYSFVDIEKQTVTLYTIAQQHMNNSTTFTTGFPS